MKRKLHQKQPPPPTAAVAAPLLPPAGSTANARISRNMHLHSIHAQASNDKQQVVDAAGTVEPLEEDGEEERPFQCENCLKCKFQKKG